MERAKPKTGATGVHIVAPGGELAFMRQLRLAGHPRHRAEDDGSAGRARAADAWRTCWRSTTRRSRGSSARATPSGWPSGCAGVDEGEVAEREEAKSISRDETFDADIHDDLLLEGELTELVGRAAAELRSEGLTARTVTVRIRDTDFTTRQASRTVDEALSSDRAIFAVARTLLAKLRKARRVPARLLGVGLSNFTAPAARQLALFDVAAPPLETPKDVEVSRAMDAVRARFGRDAIAPGRKHS